MPDPETTMSKTPPESLKETFPTMDVDPFGAKILEDPIPFHCALREAGPVVHLTKYDVLAMGRFAEVEAALRDGQSFESSAGVGLTDFRREKPWRSPSLLLEADPPHHDAPRHVLEPILSARVLRDLRPEWSNAADDLVASLRGRDVVDLVADVAERYPLRVFPDAVGIPNEGREHLLPYGDHLFNAFGPPNHLVSAGAGRVAELSAWVNAQCDRDVLRPDGFGAQIWAAVDRGDLTETQAPLVVRSLLSAGVDTTVNGLAAALHAFAVHPDQWQVLRGDPTRARVAFDEAVRWHSPVQTFFRTTVHPVEMAGHLIPEGRKILMFLGAANRDPRRWVDPDRFDLSRDPSGHVGFGMGIHQCVGQHVARLEAELVLTALSRHVEHIELLGPCDRHHNNTLRAWASLPARLHWTT
jgi:cytochrome P450